MFIRKMARPHSLYDLAEILFNDVAATQYLLDKHVFYDNITCSKCGSAMEKQINNGVFRCTRRTCSTKSSLRAHTFFYGSKLNCAQILLLAKLWLDKVSITSAMGLSGHSANTVVGFYRHFRQLVSSALDVEDTIIGGQGVIVEIDETKLGKRKYNRGHQVEGVWVLVGIERSVRRKMFCVPIEKRDAETLRNLVYRHVHPESIIYTDMWKGYDWISRDPEFEHGVVNHSVGFKDLVTGVHTNTVEGTNNGIKLRIPVRSRIKVGMEDHLAEFIWRRKHEGSNLWDMFIEAIRDIHYDIE